MSGTFLALGPSWLDPQTILDALGHWALWGAAAIIFAECGLLLGFFLPGDSLLFTVGLLSRDGFITSPLWLCCLVLSVAAVIGNVTGYEIGRAVGPKIFHRGGSSRLFKQEYVDRTAEFFDTYGHRAILLGRFVPIVRTFITVTAGVAHMDRRRYLLWSSLGGVIWGTGVTLLGSLLGQVSWIRGNIEVMLLAIVLISVVPVGVELLRARLTSSRRRRTADEPDRRAAARQDEPLG